MKKQIKKQTMSKNKRYFSTSSQKMMPPFEVLFGEKSYIKRIFFKNKIAENRSDMNEEILRRFVIRTERIKEADNNIEIINKLSPILDKIGKGESLKREEFALYLSFRKKYADIFNENRRELNSPSYHDTSEMDKITLSEIEEISQETLSFYSKWHNVNKILERRRRTSSIDADLIPAEPSSIYDMDGDI